MSKIIEATLVCDLCGASLHTHRIVVGPLRIYNPGEPSVKAPNYIDCGVAADLCDECAEPVRLAITARIDDLRSRNLLKGYPK